MARPYIGSPVTPEMKKAVTEACDEFGITSAYLVRRLLNGFLRAKPAARLLMLAEMVKARELDKAIREEKELEKLEAIAK